MQSMGLMNLIYSEHLDLQIIFSQCSLAFIRALVSPHLIHLTPYAFNSLLFILQSW